MAQIKREIRTIRIEDCNGNIYRPEGVGGGSSGDSSSSDDFQQDTGVGGGAGSITPDDMNSTSATKTTDTSSSTGKVLMIASNESKTQNIATALFSNTKFGKIAVALRLKSTDGSTTDDLIQVNTYYVDLTKTNETVKLSTTTFKGTHIGVANKFVDLGFVTEFSGIYSSNMAMKVEVLLLPASGITVSLDNVSVNRAFTAITGTPTTIS